MHDLVIAGGRVVTGAGSFLGDVAVSSGKIAALGTALEGKARVEASGRYVLPGAIDGHVHMRTERPTFCYDDTFATGSIAAAFGGTTTIIDQVQADPSLSLRTELDTRMALAEGHSAVDFAFHMNVRSDDPARLDEVRGIVALGVSSFKWFMAIPGWAVPDAILQRGMCEVSALGGLNIVHAENLGVITELRRRKAAAGERRMSHFASAYPAAAEASAVSLALAMAEAADSRILLFHQTCAEGVAAIRAAKERGVRAFGEAGLGWLLFDASVYAGDQVAALPFLLTPPVREAHHQAALWRGLRVGDLDIVSTDHAAVRMVPEATAREIADTFGVDVEAPPATDDTPRDAEGNRLMPVLPPGGVETRFPLVYSEGVRTGRLSLERWVEVCCSGPADLFDLPQKGRLLPGCDADIVLFDPEAQVTYRTDTLHSNTDYSVWDGRVCQGRIDGVWSRGTRLVDGDRWLGAPDHGRFLARTPG
ncbi:MAG: amidohydrolase family protein [Pseudomonadota bacterium]